MWIGLLFALASGMSGPVASVSPSIPVYSHDLALRVEPKPFPFTALYSKDSKRLVFIAARHENGDNNATASAIRDAFALLEPDLVIVEGFPTAIGESPAAIASIAMSRGKPAANPFANSEAMLAANIAITRHIGFVGGEPTDKQQVEALTQAGFSAPDILFADILKVFPQFLRSGQLSGPADSKFSVLYEQISETLAKNRGAEPMPWSEFEARYRATFGVAPAADPDFAKRAEPSSPSLVGKILAAEGQVRDEAILALITHALQKHQRILVVYGGSHWTTLSSDLERELGKPTIS